MTQPTSSRAGKLALLAFLFTMAAVLFFVFILPAIIFGLQKGLVTYVTDQLVSLSGWNRNLLLGLLIPTVVPLFWAIRELLRVRFPWGKSAGHILRPIAHLVFVGYISGYFFILFFAARNSNFDQSGRALKFCAETPEGLVCEDEPGADRKYGLTLEPMTPEQVITIERRLRGQIPQRIAVNDIDSIEFFDKLDARPKVWFYNLPSGGIELFDRHGKHPTYGADLKPVASAGDVDRIRAYFGNVSRDAQLAREAEEAERQNEETAARRRREEAARVERERKYFNSAFLDPRFTSVLVVDESGSVDYEMGTQIADSVGGTTGFVTDAFVSDGMFRRALNGDLSTMQEFIRVDRLPRLILVQQSSRAAESSAAGENLVKTETVLRGRVYNTPVGSSSKAVTVEGRGVGFSEDEALKKSRQSAIKEFLQKLN